MVTVNQLQPIWLYLSVGLIGACFGSFFNVVIYRLPKMLFHSWRNQCQLLLNQREEILSPAISLLKPRSFCPHCKTIIPLYRNIPLITYLIQRGRCANCKMSIAWRYPLVELLSGLLAIFIVYHFGLSWQALAACIFTGYLIILMFIDIDHQLLPDDLTLPLLWLGLLVNLNGWFTDINSAVLGAVGGYLILWMISRLYYFIRKREGMGYGDFKLLAVFGAWVGIQQLIFIMLAASVLGIVGAIYLLIMNRIKKHEPLPFGPYLVIAGWIAMMWGPAIMQWYWTL